MAKASIEEGHLKELLKAAIVEVLEELQEALASYTESLASGVKT